MNKRPCSITVIGWIFIALGGILTLADLLPLVDAAAAQRFSEFKAQHPFQYDIIWVGLVRLIAIVCGVYMLRGHNWARWLALAWIVYHVILSAFHMLSELAIHILLCAILAYFLFRPTATRYFRAAGA